MHPIDHTRRRVWQLAAMAPAAMALPAWTTPVMPQHAGAPGTPFQFATAPEGIHWMRGNDRSCGLFLPLGLNFALMPGSISPDGRHLALTALDRRTGSNIWVAPIQLRDGQPVAGTLVPFCHSGTMDVNPRFTADGRWISYASRRAGKWILQTRRFADTGRA